ncbi:MAG: hypothetical protein J5I52_02335 [Saprospiraceae bacterium]|nr:hypothetical protein [Saprospiraceae bacterium]MCZ2338278.1 hypothetical protein [Chitinophagales bacterium]
MLRIALLLTILSTLIIPISAQYDPFDLYLAEFSDDNAPFELKKISFLNSFNPKGYNNQPRFFDKKTIYITSLQPDEKFTDIIALQLTNKNMFKVTDTDGISEFSPTPTPDNHNFTTVRIERDGVDQSLWRYPLSRTNSGMRLLPKLNNIGYYSWLDYENVALFLVANPPQLAIANTVNQKVSIITDHIGRCLKTNSKGLLYFVHKTNNLQWFLKTYDPVTGQFNTVCSMPRGTEDFELVNDDMILAADDSRLLKFEASSDLGWQELYDFAGYGIHHIQRMSWNHHRLVFTAKKQPE